MKLMRFFRHLKSLASKIAVLTCAVLLLLLTSCGQTINENDINIKGLTSPLDFFNLNNNSAGFVPNVISNSLNFQIKSAKSVKQVGMPSSSASFILNGTIIGR